ncbi:hypothetical protein FUA23_05520 [Neolewinella aurantiaca]|uniref:Tetratricopeptide repeat protein n=1 Tax=Neolewinella aurantiaca TaxID=2602767 RepID=A0A5C7FHH1_9BACT|nr:hypothetical protein [Neolewinella aurantiaca]TXF90557.1 hypothetical protein FUA23_05520 [Neolewinella aurantiaca]
MTTQAQIIYNRILAMELDGAQSDLDVFRERYPTNLAAEHLESYLDFFRLYLNGDERIDERLSARFDRRIDALEDGEESSPYFRYALAEARLHRSLIHLRFERHLAAFRELNKAHKLLRDNAKEFPDFLLTYKDLGLLHAAVGSIPPQYKWGVELFSSLNGTIAEGRAEIALALSDENNPFLLETQVLSAFLELHLAGEPEAAFEKINNLGLKPKTNSLHCFILANLAMRSGRNDLALRTLENQPRGGAAEDFPYLDFMLGLAKLRTLDPTARLYFQSFNVRYAGRHFKEEAQQKIAWAYLLGGDEEGYHKAMSRIGGGSKAGGDQNAAMEAARHQIPQPELLRARLLFDGNYCTRARARLEKIDISTLSEIERLEYYYRTGRVLDGLNDYDGALSFYLQTVRMGRDNPAFYACKSALQAGLIEEKRGNKELAQKYFSDCLDISPAEYKTGLHILAKSGLDRVQ